MIAAGVLLGYLSYKKFKFWKESRKLNQLVILQNKLHALCKKSLKILRRTWAKKSTIFKVYEKQEYVHMKKFILIFIVN